jgi:glycosyltransferase involved in cell wall biosynthesis
MFAPGDAVGAGDALRGLLSDATRSRLSDDERQLVSQSFGIEDHVDRVLAEYAAARGARVAQGAVVVAAESR